MAQLFIRRETTFSILSTKTFDPTKCGAPQFYAEAFSEGLTFMRDHFSSLGRRSGRQEQLLQMVVIEWLRFQNPHKTWGDRTPLPGQLHPGLGIVYEMNSMLKELCTLRGRDGVLDVPEHWYNSYLYSRLPQPYRFLNPAFEGYFQSMRIALEPEIKKHGLPAVAWAIVKGQLRCEIPQPGEKAEEKRFEWIKWVAQEQVSAITPRLRSYFESALYTDIVKRYTRPELFSVDWEARHHLAPAASIGRTLSNTVITNPFATPTPSPLATAPATSEGPSLSRSFSGTLRSQSPLLHPEVPCPNPRRSPSPRLSPKPTASSASSSSSSPSPTSSSQSSSSSAQPSP